MRPGHCAAIDNVNLLRHHNIRNMEVLNKEQLTQLSQQISKDFPWALADLPLAKELEELQLSKPSEDIHPGEDEEDFHFTEVNLLILGEEIDAGKSIWISGFASSLTCSSLDEALNKPGIRIPLQFEILDPCFCKHVVSIGSSSDENATVPFAGTVTFGTYPAKNTGRIIRMLSPLSVRDGNDTAEKYRRTEAIVKHLGTFGELHGICILLKSGTGLTPALQELLSVVLGRLHRDARRHIVFVFTDAGSPINLPVDTVAKLEELLAAGVEFHRETLYCFDNDVFRCMLALQNGVEIGAVMMKGVSSCWAIAADEAERLLKHIEALPPYKTEATQPIAMARELYEAIVEMIAAESWASEFVPVVKQRILQDKLAEIEKAKTERDELRRQTEINPQAEKVRRLLEQKDQEIAKDESIAASLPLNQPTVFDRRQREEMGPMLLVAAKVRVFLKEFCAVPGKDTMEQLLMDLVAAETEKVASGSSRDKLSIRQHDLKEYRVYLMFWNEEIRTKNPHRVTMEAIRADVKILKTFPNNGLMFRDFAL
ncbi:uncharacterized protein LOC129588872 [Paramacrobiotus metropolitanus]|uniref:uncharacterized protein LOC129588872 n=1 Tax=Paramacrobiotus metropolitanus TaxID=2943436 RepID=UPI0024456CDA|nr:uncharacterized protein LOC129588872 [Paramacrobiotus metropolitanus]